MNWPLPRLKSTRTSSCSCSDAFFFALFSPVLEARKDLGQKRLLFLVVNCLFCGAQLPFDALEPSEEYVSSINLNTIQLQITYLAPSILVVEIVAHFNINLKAKDLVKARFFELRIKLSLDRSTFFLIHKLQANCLHAYSIAKLKKGQFLFF